MSAATVAGTPVTTIKAGHLGTGGGHTSRLDIQEANTNSGGMQEYRDNNHFHKNCVLNKSPNGNNKPKLNVEMKRKEKE
jgi:hypothetical protein